jgi:FkbM family methyltransferase
MNDLRPSNRAPLLFRVAKALERRGIRGSSRILRSLRLGGSLDRPVEFHLGGGIDIVVPIARNEYDGFDLDTYEADLLHLLAEYVRKLSNVTLIDVGADIGVFSLKLLAGAPCVRNIIALEPNGEGFRWLELNLSRLDIPARAIHAAAANFQGKGRLAKPESRWRAGGAENHTQFFLEPCPEGDIEVTTIDSLAGLPQDLVIKVDVEGGELAVLRGATATISRAANVIVVIEAHPAVAARTGVDPVECLRLLESLRPMRFTLGETRGSVGTGRGFFEQVAPDRIYNVIAESISGVC